MLLPLRDEEEALALVAEGMEEEVVAVVVVGIEGEEEEEEEVEQPRCSSRRSRMWPFSQAPESWASVMSRAPEMRPRQVGLAQRQSKGWAMVHSVEG